MITLSHNLPHRGPGDHGAIAHNTIAASAPTHSTGNSTGNMTTNMMKVRSASTHAGLNLGNIYRRFFILEVSIASIYLSRNLSDGHREFDKFVYA